MASTVAGVTAPAFDSNKVTVIYVLGGPGAGKLTVLVWPTWSDICPGKGTQCGKLVEDFNFSHLSGESMHRSRPAYID
jgi:UMP-CMP kinase